MTTVTISQSNYLPWRGYFSQISNSDHFVFLDNVQFTPRDWRTRNRIRTPQGPEWINVPVVKPDSRFEIIENIRIASDSFIQNHLEKIRRNYSRSKFFDPNWMVLQNILNDSYHENLSVFNQKIIESISQNFSLSCNFVNASQIKSSEEPTQRLLDICLALGATTYQTGARAKTYLDVTKFQAKGIEVVWSEYNFHDYQQLWDLAFDPNLSIIDLILNMGFDRNCLADSKRVSNE